MGPIKEEARLLRAAARLELSASLSPERVEERSVLDRGAASDLAHLLENLSPPSEVFRAALHLRGLALEREGLESLALVQDVQGKASPARRAAAERLEGAMEAFERALATADAWSPAPGGGGEPVRGWVIAALDRLASIAEKVGRLDVARECLTRLSALGDSGSPIQPDGPRLRVILSFPPHEIEALVASAGYRRGDLAFFQGDLDRALEEYTSALTHHGMSPLAPWGHLRRAEIFRRKRDDAACRKELELLRFRLEIEEKTAAEPAAGAGVLRRWRGAYLSHLTRFESAREEKR
jgi:tetratricopeptide (TPR) repeat protein